MKSEEAVKRLHELAEMKDFEIAHIAADEVLCDLLRSLGHEEVADAFNEVGRWYA